MSFLIESLRFSRIRKKELQKLYSQICLTASKRTIVGANKLLTPIKIMGDETPSSALHTTANNARVVVSHDGWEDKWKKGNTTWHSDNVHGALLQYHENLLQGKENLRVFLPLCGKDPCLKWFYERGHTVVGVEIAKQPIDEFFSEHGLEHEIVSVPEINCSLYKTPDNRLRIYTCDLFKLSSNIEGDFDAVWDRASLVAINLEDRQKYTNFICNSMKSDARCLLVTYVYDGSIWKGTPHTMTEKEVSDLYENNFSIETLDFFSNFTEKHKKWGLSEFHTRVQLLIKK